MTTKQKTKSAMTAPSLFQATWLTTMAWEVFGGWVMCCWDAADEGAPISTRAYHAREDIESNLRHALAELEKQKTKYAVLSPDIASFIGAAFDLVDWNLLAELARAEEARGKP